MESLRKLGVRAKLEPDPEEGEGEDTHEMREAGQEGETGRAGEGRPGGGIRVKIFVDANLLIYLNVGSMEDILEEIGRCARSRAGGWVAILEDAGAEPPKILI